MEQDHGRDSGLGAQICWLTFGSGQSLVPVGVRSESSLRLGSWVEPGSRRSPSEVRLQPELGMRSGSRRSPGEVYLQLKSGAKSGSLRSPDEVYQQLRSETEPGSHRSPGEAFPQLRSGTRSGWSLPAAGVGDKIWLP